MIGSASILGRWETDANRVYRHAESCQPLLIGRSGKGPRASGAQSKQDVVANQRHTDRAVHLLLCDLRGNVLIWIIHANRKEACRGGTHSSNRDARV